MKKIYQMIATDGTNHLELYFSTKQRAENFGKKHDLNFIITEYGIIE